MTYEPALVARIVGYMLARRLKGEGPEKCSQNLRIPMSRLRWWLARSRYERPTGPAKRPPFPLLLRPAKVTAETVHIPDGVPEKRYTNSGTLWS